MKYNVEDVKADNTDDFAKHIKVTIMYNTSSATNEIVETTLYDLQNQTPDLTAIQGFVVMKKLQMVFQQVKRKRFSYYLSSLIMEKTKINSKATS
jgi:Camelysin metallo-endopeptidase